MSLPVGVVTKTVTIGRPFDWQGNTGTMSLTVTPIFGGNATRLVWAATGETFEQNSLPIGTSTDDDTNVSFALPVVDQAGWRDTAGNAITGWSYAVSVSTKFGSTTMRPYVKNVGPRASDTAPIDLDLLPDGPPAVPTFDPAPALAASDFARVVAHGSDATVARPVAAVVIWAGSVQPTHMDPDFDLWVGP